MGKSRVEAFSDGVMAVVITLLVLDLHVDAHSSVDLVTQLRQQWPSYAAYLISFCIISVIWLNHHNLFRIAARIDPQVMVYNLALLLFVTAIPFTTATYADYAQGGGANARVAVLMYGIALEGMTVSFVLILARIFRANLTRSAVPRPVARKIVRRYALGALVYPVVTAIGLINAPLMLLLYGMVVVYYLALFLRRAASDEPSTERDRSPSNSLRDDAIQD